MVQARRKLLLAMEKAHRVLFLGKHQHPCEERQPSVTHTILMPRIQASCRVLALLRLPIISYPNKPILRRGPPCDEQAEWKLTPNNSPLNSRYSSDNITDEKRRAKSKRLDKVAKSTSGPTVSSKIQPRRRISGHFIDNV